MVGAVSRIPVEGLYMSEHGYGQERPQYGPPPGQQAYQGQQGYPGQQAYRGQQAYEDQQAYRGQQAYQVQAGYPGQDAGYPGQGAAAYGIAPQQQEVSKGLVGSLFDFGFTSFATPKIAKVVYVIATIVLGLAALGFLIFCFSLNALFGIVALVIVCPLFFFLNLAIWRILTELFIVIFQMAEDIRALRIRGDMD
jgi:hypothetical protein